MTRRLPNLNAVRAFEAAARHLSFSRAADELCVTQGAVSRQIKALEAHFGVLLFRRMTRAVELTEEGTHYLQAARAAFDGIELAGMQLRRAAGHGVLTVSVLPTFAMRWLIPPLPRFAASFPETEVRMITSISPVNFGRDDVDLAIRVGHPPETARPAGRPRIDLQMVDDWSSVHADLLMPDVLVPVCSPALLRGRARPQAPADLPRFGLLHTASRSHAWPDWFRALGVECAEAAEGPAYGHFFMAMQAAADGLGIVLVPRALAEADLAAGRLVLPLDQAAESDGAYYVLCRRQQREAAPIRQFRDWLFRERDRPLPDAA